MKTKEFLRIVEDELGYAADKSENYITIKKESGKFDALFAMIAINKVLGFDTSFHNFTSLDKHDRNLLFDLILEYARTPLDEREEREEEKKYRYKFPFRLAVTEIEKEAHLRKEELRKNLSSIVVDTSGVDFAKKHSDFHFTDKEVEQYTGKDRALFIVCEKIEVTS